MVTLFVLGQNQQVIVLVAFARRAVVLVLADVQLAAQDRLDSLGFSRIEKVDRPINVSVVSHRDRGLPQRRHPVDEFGEVASPIQQRVLRMQMQMREFTHG